MNLYTYQTVNGAASVCNGFSFSFRADSREQADIIAADMALALQAEAKFLKVI